jgi:PAS domain S-box-containing protein
MISILYVDDEPGLLEIGKLFLERSGEFGVDVITSAPDALILMDTKAYDAIISDFRMPGMDGIEFLKEVRNSGNMIPFILFTGRGREEIAIQALNEGADFYLQKGGEPLSQFTELAHQTRLAVQQRRAEASIRDHERREADILNFLPDATFAIDRTGKVLAWNQAMEKLTGVKFSEIMGKDNYEYALWLYNERRPVLIDLVLVPNEEIEKGRYLYTIRENKMLTAESVFEKPDGTRVHLWAKASLLFDQNGNIAGAIEAIRDITERKKSETELRAAYEQITAAEEELRTQNNELALSEQQVREREENFQSLVESAPDAIYISIGEKFAYVNPAMVRLMGATSADQLLGMSLYDRIHPSFREAIHERARVVIDEGKPVGLQETVYLKMDGTPLEIESAVTPFRYHNHFAGHVILRDISRRKQAEKMLRESEERYRRIVETANEGILEMDEKFNMVYVNRRMADMLGYTPEETIGRNIHSFIAAEDIPDNIPKLKERMEGKSDRFERRFVTKDKRIRWMQVSVTPRMDPDGTFRGSFAMCSDITDRKAAEEEIARKNEDIYAAYEQLTATEEELRQNYDKLVKNQKLLKVSERKYRNVIEDQTEFICRFLPDGTHVFVNEAYCRYFGLKRDEIVGHRFQPKVPVEDKERLRRFFASLSPDHPTDTIENRIIMPDGTLRWQRWSDRGIFDPSGTVTEYQTVGRDITEEKATKAALERSEIRFREQYQNNPLAIFTWQHREGDFVLVGCNKTAEALTGGRAGAYLGRHASDLYEARPELISEIGQCFSGQTVISRDGISEHFLPGRHIHTTASFVPPDLVMVHVEDITGQRQAEEALRQANRNLNLLYGITRHDINNQLMALNGFIELLHEKAPDPALDYYFGWIAQSMARISAMIQFTKEYEEIGITSPHWQDVRTIVDTAALEAPLGKVRVQNEIPAGSELFADQLIVRVFYNIMENAVRYGSRITTIRFFLEDRNGDHIIVCEDDGLGIPHADKEKIFERGFGKNTGLGLFLAREILSITGITITESGEPGKGARFEMTLPHGAFRRSDVQ